MVWKHKHETLVRNIYRYYEKSVVTEKVRSKAWVTVCLVREREIHATAA